MQSFLFTLLILHQSLISKHIKPFTGNNDVVSSADI